MFHNVVLLFAQKSIETSVSPKTHRKLCVHTKLFIPFMPCFVECLITFSLTSQQAERKLDILQPRVETILKESKTVTSRDSPGSDTIRHSLLDLSGRWLKACDDVDRNKRAVKIVPNWYQFRSNLEEINNSLKKYEGDDKPERYVKVSKPLTNSYNTAVFVDYRLRVSPILVSKHSQIPIVI